MARDGSTAHAVLEFANMLHVDRRARLMKHAMVDDHYLIIHMINNPLLIVLIGI